MKTTELQISQEELIKGSLNKRRRRRYRGMGGPMPPVPLDGEPYQDRIARATEREREHRRVRLPEGDGVWAHVFRCVCCGRLRGDQERREARSLVCIRCVREAGYWN